MVFKICEGISCSSFSFKELGVIVHKDYFLIRWIYNVEYLSKYKMQAIQALPVKRERGHVTSEILSFGGGGFQGPP